jgi:lipoprotein NlpD
MKNNIFTALILSLLVSCATRIAPAPIVNATNIPDYLQIKQKVAANVNDEGYTLGSLNDNNNAKTQPQTVQKTPAANNKAPQEANAKLISAPDTPVGNKDWVSPTNGVVVNKFTPVSKGVDYKGTIGQSINAVNDGKVVYSGNGLKGYGNLIIIKHSNVYLSAYAHNESNLVKDGDIVKRGQKIATMGDVNNKPVLHLEIRQNGKPIDPLTLIN